KDKILYQLCIINIDYVSKLDNQEVDFDGSSFNDFLQEIEDDYKTCSAQLRMAFDKFAERYKAAKS
ncbi:17649_t:CDS:1, partial [Cetraspora pellucida]